LNFESIIVAACRNYLADEATSGVASAAKSILIPGEKHDVVIIRDHEGNDLGLVLAYTATVKYRVRPIEELEKQLQGNKSVIKPAVLIDLESISSVNLERRLQAFREEARNLRTDRKDLIETFRGHAGISWIGGVLNADLLEVLDRRAMALNSLVDWLCQESWIRLNPALASIDDRLEVILDQMPDLTDL
jgi:hypothetical protein